MKQKYKIPPGFLKNFKESTVILFSTLLLTFIIGFLIFKSTYFVDFPTVTPVTEKDIPEDMFLSILKHNILVSSIILLVLSKSKRKSGLDFVEKGYFVYLGSIGGIAVSYVAVKINILYSIMLIIPHGIIELPAMCILMSSKYFLAEEKDINKKIKSFLKIISTIAILFVIAAYIEAYYTIRIASMFL